MNWYPRTLLRYLFLLCLFFLLDLTAQDIQRYQGFYTVGDYAGDANFSYKIVQGDTVFQGPFQMQRSNLGNLMEESDQFFGFLGSFENGYPNGYWKFQFGEFKANETSEVVGFQYRVNISGAQLEASGEIQMGKPNGEWVFTEQTIENSEAQETLFKSAITFNNGVPQQSFRIENDSLTLLGRFLRNGLAHDSWICYTKDSDATENWVFRNGILESIQIDNEETSKNISFQNFLDSGAKTIFFDARYFKILGNWIENDTEITANIPKLLEQNESYYAKIDTILSAIGTAEFHPAGKVKVPYFPMDSIQKVQGVKIANRIRASDSISAFFLQNSQLNLLRRSDSEVAHQVAALEALSMAFVKPLMKIAEYENLGILEYLNRDKLIKKLFPDGYPSTLLKIQEGQGGTYSGPKADTFNFEGDFFEAIGQMTEYTSLCVDSIAEVLNQKTTQVEQKEELMLLENDMVSLVDSLKTQEDNTTILLPKIYQNTRVTLSEFAEQLVTQYSNAKDDNKKLLMGREAVKCLNTVQTLSETIGQLPDQLQEIKKTYEDDVWNPFMATIMKEEVKKRITSAYENILIPYALQTLSSQTDCNQIEKAQSFLNAAHERIMELRDEETSKLERKLRREKDVRTVIQLLGLQPLENN